MSYLAHILTLKSLDPNRDHVTAIHVGVRCVTRVCRGEKAVGDLMFTFLVICIRNHLQFRSQTLNPGHPIYSPFEGTIPVVLHVLITGYVYSLVL